MAPTYAADRFPWARGIDYRAVISEIDQNRAPGDTIVTSEHGQFGMAWDYYARVSSRNLFDPENAGRVWFINDDFNCSEARAIRELGLGNELKICTQG